MQPGRIGLLLIDLLFFLRLLLGLDVLKSQRDVGRRRHLTGIQHGAKHHVVTLLGWGINQ